LFFFIGAIVSVGLGLFLLSKLVFHKKPKTCKGCNVILISLDTLGANHMPCYGYERETSKNLCQFAEENVFFSQSSANGVWTLPSHVSIFTGLYSEHHKVNFSYKDSLDPSLPFLPSILKEKNYQVIFHIPKEDVSLPRDRVYSRGIDEFLPYDNNAERWSEFLKAFEEINSKGKKVFAFFHSYAVHDPYTLSINEELIYPVEKISELILPTNETDSVWSQELVRYLIEQLKEDINHGECGEDKNICQIVLRDLELNQNNVKELKKAVYNNQEERMRVWQLINTHIHNFSYYEQYFNKLDLSDEKQIEFIKAVYDQKIYRLDENIDKFLDSFFNSSLKDKTILIITADHGEEFMEHGFVSHVSLYNFNLKVPLMMYIPGISKAVIDKPVQGVDITPTILDLLGISYDFSFDGQSLAKLIFGGKEQGLDERLLIASGLDLKSRAVSKGKWKLILYQDENNKDQLVMGELYNLEIDPDEKNDVLLANYRLAEKIYKQYQRIRL